MTDKQKCIGKDGEFPLDEYITVYNWIGDWVEEARDAEHVRIAQAAYDSLTDVGIFMRDTMREMADRMEDLPRLIRSEKS